MQRRSRIGRRVYTTKCHVIMYDENNERKEFDYDIVGNYNDIERANNKISKELGTNRIVVSNITCESKYYSMPMSEFVKYADQISD